MWVQPDIINISLESQELFHLHPFSANAVLRDLSSPQIDFKMELS